MRVSPLKTYWSHAVSEKVESVLLITVRFNVAVLSQPSTFVIMVSYIPVAVRFRPSQT